MGIHVELVAKAWDLADAYHKQVPLSDSAFDMDAFLVVFTSGGPEVFQQRVLPCGSVASVTAFLRVANSLWKIGTRLLGLMWSSYFDDFFSVVEKGAARHKDLVISSMSSILGWRLAADKLIDFNTVCEVLGVQFDLRMSGEGLYFVTNTDDRILELCESLDEILVSGSLSRGDGERLRGRLLFAAGQLFGRPTRNHIRILSLHVQRGKKTLNHDTLCALRHIREKLALNVPRKIVGSLTDHVHIYVDASFDESAYSGVGGVMYDSSGF